MKELEFNKYMEKKRLAWEKYKKVTKIARNKYKNQLNKINVIEVE